MDNFLYFIVIGAIAGWVSSKLIKGESFGLIGNIIVGVVGAVLGGWIFEQLGIVKENILYTLAAAVVDSISFLFFVGMLKLK